MAAADLGFLEIVGPIALELIDDSRKGFRATARTRQNI